MIEKNSITTVTNEDPWNKTIDNDYIYIELYIDILAT